MSKLFFFLLCDFIFQTGLNQFGPAYVAFLSVRMTGYLKKFSTTLYINIHTHTEQRWQPIIAVTAY
jgi:hypothetical protein